MTDLVQTLRGCDRAAVLLLSLEEQDAAAVLRLMAPQEVERLSVAMAAQMGNQAMLAACLSRRPAAGGEPLSDALREKFERRSGVPLDDVRVHHNSDTPEQLDAEACARGNEVFIGPGNEKDLEHEVGHVVQQKQGLVQATNKVNCVAINDNEALENSALFPQRKTVRRPEGQNPLNARVTQLCKGKKETVTERMP